MKMIKPIVNLAKIADNYDTFILGYNGVLSEGNGLLPGSVEALANLRAEGKKIVLVSNTSLRLAELLQILRAGGVTLDLFNCVMTAGEILHYKLKVRQGDYAAVGSDYYLIGSEENETVFAGLDYRRVPQLENAHFVYMGSVSSPQDTLDKYRPVLEHAAGLGLPFVCAGNDTSSYCGGKICVAPGAVAEQYAVMGGRILTLGKPDVNIFKYCLDGLDDIGKILIVGDNIATDIKGAVLLGVDSVLVSKGVHVNFLGEGYIPDVAKTRELSNNYDASPDYVISRFRW